LSDEAFQDREMLVPVVAETRTLPGTVGGDVSEHPVVPALTVATVDRFPAASTASTPSVYELLHERPVNVPCVVEDDDTLVPPR
jgi:hypothetical protein